MRSYIAAACIVLGWLASPAPARAQAVRSDQDVLIQLERQWNDAFYRKDMAFLQNVLAEEYISTYEDGTKGDKAKELAETATFNQHVDSAKQEDFLVKVYGDTAVWFSLRLTGPKQGKLTESCCATWTFVMWTDAGSASRARARKSPASRRDGSAQIPPSPVAVSALVLLCGALLTLRHGTGRGRLSVRPIRMIDRDEVRRVETSRATRRVHAHDDVVYHLWIHRRYAADHDRQRRAGHGETGQAFFTRTPHGFKNTVRRQGRRSRFIKQTTVAAGGLDPCASRPSSRCFTERDPSA